MSESKIQMGEQWWKASTDAGSNRTLLLLLGSRQLFRRIQELFPMTSRFRNVTDTAKATVPNTSWNPTYCNPQTSEVRRYKRIVWSCEYQESIINQYMCNSKVPSRDHIQHNTPAAAGSLQLLLSHNRNQIELERDCEKAVRRLSIPRNTAYYRAAQTRESNTFNNVFGYIYTMSVKQCVFLDQTHIHHWGSRIQEHVRASFSGKLKTSLQNRRRSHKKDV